MENLICKNFSIMMRIYYYKNKILGCYTREVQKTKSLGNSEVLLLLKGRILDRIKFPSKLRFENQQKKTHCSKKQKQALVFSLLRFQLFVDLFVTSTGFKPVTF